MTPLSPVPFQSAGSAGPSDPQADLDRLLSRLQRSVLLADDRRVRRLKANEFERSKLAKNIQHARALLARLEQRALSVKVQPLRRTTQAELDRKREILDGMAERMSDLDELAAHCEDDDDGSSADDRLLDSISGLTPAPVVCDDRGQAQSSASLSWHPEVQHVSSQREEPPPRPTEPKDAAPSGPRSRSSDPGVVGLAPRLVRPRARGPRSKHDNTHRTQRGLVDERHVSQPNRTASTEAILDQQRAEQDLLSELMLKMATGLRQSSAAISSSLEEDKTILDRAGEGLSKNEQGLEAAARRTRALALVTEGKGWWGRIMLYGYIYGMMVALVLLVFALPKLRF